MKYLQAALIGCVLGVLAALGDAYLVAYQYLSLPTACLAAGVVLVAYARVMWDRGRPGVRA